MPQGRNLIQLLTFIGACLLIAGAFAEEVSQPAGSKPQFSEQFQRWLQKNNAPQTMTRQGHQLVADNRTYSQNDRSTASQSAGKRFQRPGSPNQDREYIERQKQMLEAIPPDSPQPSPESKQAFRAMLKKNIPLSPEQVVKLRQQIDISQRAAAIPANIPPKPVSSTLMINLAPGTTPPAVRLAQGYVSSLVFVDSTGAPWPVASFDIGNPKAVNIQWDGKSNIILVQGSSPYFNGNMVVRLVGLSTPITLELVTGQRVVDYRVDMHVSGIGPNTKNAPTGTDLPNSANQLLLSVLDGVAPPGSKELKVHGANSQAWLLGGKLYLRTRFTVLSPGWVGKMTSPDGMIAYELSKTSSVLISRYGEPAELKIEGL